LPCPSKYQTGSQRNQDSRKNAIGEKAELKIPPGTRAGTKFRLRDLGLALKERRGDQIVEIDIKVPENMTDEEKRMFNEMAEKAGARG